MQTKKEKKIDLEKLNRVVYVLGLDTILSLAKLNVFIYGLSGLGVEIAKNVILGNVNSVTVYDTRVASNFDLSTQFYISKEDVESKKTRAQASISKLIDLNPEVDTSNYEGEITEEFLKQFQVVVLANCDNQDHWKIVNETCRKNKIGFIDAQLRGLFSRIFVDFGEVHRVKDHSGKEPLTFLITSISKDKQAIVRILEKGPKIKQLEEGDTIEFLEVQGMSEINGKKAKIVKYEGDYSCIVDIDTTNFSEYLSSGVLKEVQLEQDMHFKSYEEAVQDPGDFFDIPVMDYANMEGRSSLHFAFLALQQYMRQHNAELPRISNEEDAKKLVEISQEINKNFTEKKVFNVEKLEETLIHHLSFFSRLEIVPMSCFLGGVVAQEVMKITGKFKPIRQFFYFDCHDLLNDWKPTEVKLEGGRYDSTIAIFGNEFQRKIEELKLFLVGSGALGCEWLKNLSLMGIGNIEVTDMDQIERSNLSRQFLFREHDVGQMKSVCGANAAKKFNDKINVTPYTKPVGVDTENFFHSAFWEKLDVVVNALDNWKARLYVDSQIVKYHLPLLEGGTLGATGHTETILPNLTVNFGAHAVTQQETIPMCTLHHFPENIEHCIQWSKDMFEGVFSSDAKYVNQYLTKSDFLETLASKNNTKTQIRILRSLLKHLNFHPRTFEKCVELARLDFENNFSNRIKIILHSFPSDFVEDGVPFWRPPRRVPSPLKFDVNNPLHYLYVESTSFLYAFMYKIDTKGITESQVKEFLSKVNVPEFKPSTLSLEALNRGETEDESQKSETEVLEDLKKDLPKPSEILSMDPSSFEKDDDSNHHVDFIHSCANLRASNYSITNIDRLKSRRIVGNIVPAIATTTACIVGLMNIDLFRLIQKRKVDSFKNWNIDLAQSYFSYNECDPPIKTKETEKEGVPIPTGWTVWDSIKIQLGDITIRKLLTFMKENYGVNVNVISVGNHTLYRSYDHNKTELQKLKITERYLKVSEQESIPSHLDRLDLTLNAKVSESKKTANLPTVRFFFKKKGKTTKRQKVDTNKEDN